MRKLIFKYGRDIKIRNHRRIRNTLTAMIAGPYG